VKGEVREGEWSDGKRVKWLTGKYTDSPPGGNSPAVV